MSTLLLILFLMASVIVLAGGVAIIGFVSVLQGTNSVNERLETYAMIPEIGQNTSSDRRKARLIRYRLRLNNMLSVFASEKLSLQLSSANWPISETEFILVRIWLVLVGLIAGWL